MGQGTEITTELLDEIQLIPLRSRGIPRVFDIRHDTGIATAPGPAAHS